MTECGTPAEHLRAAREMAGLTKSQAAAACDKHAPGWHDWESGRKTPSPRALALALATLCDLAARRWKSVAARLTRRQPGA